MEPWQSIPFDTCVKNSPVCCLSACMAKIVHSTSSLHWPIFSPERGPLKKPRQHDAACGRKPLSIPQEVLSMFREEEGKFLSQVITASFIIIGLIYFRSTKQGRSWQNEVFSTCSRQLGKLRLHSFLVDK